MVQKKLPLINSAHGSETRNIINELIKLFNGMGYTYDEALSQAHVILKEAQQTNDMNKDVQEQIDRLIISDGQSDAEVIQARGGLPLLKDRLDESDAQLAQKVGKGNVSINDIDKNRGLLDETYMSDEFLQQMAGNTPIHATPADESITVKKTVFGTPGKNMFNPDGVTGGFILDLATGEAVSGVSYVNVTPLIEVKRNTYYVLSKHFENVVMYDEEQAFIEGRKTISTEVIIIKTTENTQYIRASIYNNGLPNAQIEEGTEISEYEPYELLIDSKYLKQENIKKEYLPKIGLEDTNIGVRSGKNLFNKKNIYPNLTLTVTGEITENSSQLLSGFIEIKPDTVYTMTGVTTHGWYDEDYNHIRGGTVGFNVTSPPNGFFARISAPKENIDFVQIETGSARTSYEPYKEVINEKYLPEQQGGQNGTIVSFNDDYEARKAITERNALDFIPNVSEPLNIPSYVPEGVSGREGITHPNVLYFENGWNGYKFWMAMTPYPMSQNEYENPSIVASNDNINWVEPAPNPIAPLEEGTTFQSDPELVMKGDTMEMWYRATLNTAGNLDTTFYRMTTTDGVNWTPREAMFTNNNRTDGEVVSPAIIFGDDIYKMWFTRRRNDVHTMEYAESEDGKNWDSRALDIDLKFKDYHFWHGDVYKHDDGKIDMVIGCKSPTNPWSMFYTYSYDNVNWVEPMLLIKPRTASNYWDSGHMYKPGITMVDDEIYLYYSTPSRIGLTKGKTMFELGAHHKKELEELHPVKHLRSAMNAYTVDNTFEDFPENAIIYTKVWWYEDRGWPELSGNLITYCIWKEAGDVKQVFQPKGKNIEHVRTARSNGWTDWVLKS